jgi:hypothetical protein
MGRVRVHQHRHVATTATYEPFHHRPLASAAVLALVALGQGGKAGLSQAASLLPPQAPVQVEVEARITAVNAAAGTITVQDSAGPATVVALGAVRGPY